MLLFVLVFVLLEEDWSAHGSDLEGQLQTCLTAIIFIAGFFAALRGEEIVRVDLGAMHKHWDEAVNFRNAPHVALMLSGRFKRETGEKLFCQPLQLQIFVAIKSVKRVHQCI